jgi:hypothetical protein
MRREVYCGLTLIMRKFSSSLGFNIRMEIIRVRVSELGITDVGSIDA